jgi:hypothetical protein
VAVSQRLLGLICDRTEHMVSALRQIAQRCGVMQAALLHMADSLASSQQAQLLSACLCWGRALMQLLLLVITMRRAPRLMHACTHRSMRPPGRLTAAAKLFGLLPGKWVKPAQRQHIWGAGSLTAQLGSSLSCTARLGGEALAVSTPHAPYTQCGMHTHWPFGKAAV